MHRHARSLSPFWMCRRFDLYPGHPNKWAEIDMSPHTYTRPYSEEEDTYSDVHTYYIHSHIHDVSRDD